MKAITLKEYIDNGCATVADLAAVAGVTVVTIRNWSKFVYEPPISKAMLLQRFTAISEEKYCLTLETLARPGFELSDRDLLVFWRIIKNRRNE